MIKETQELAKDLEELEVKLKAIDTSLELHHIKLDVDLIDPIESKELRINIPHGELTKSILTCIRLYGEHKPVSKSIVTKFVITRHFDFDADPVELAQINMSIKRRFSRFKPSRISCKTSLGRNK